MTDRAKGASHWDDRYRTAQQAGREVWSLGPNRFVAEELADLPPGHGVDLGAGDGRHALWLASRGWRMTAVDFSSVAVDAGARRAAERGLAVSWVVADATSWEPETPVDLVLLAYLHLPLAEVAVITARAGAWLVPGGTLLVVGHDIDNLESGVGGPRDPNHLYHGEMEFPGLRVVRNVLLERTGDGRKVALDRLVRAVRPWEG